MSESTYWADDGHRRRVGEQLLATANGAWLADLRKSLGLTQATMAAAIGLPRGRISQIECGEPVSLEVLRTYVAGLGGRVEVVATFGSLWLRWRACRAQLLARRWRAPIGDVGTGRVPERRQRLAQVRRRSPGPSPAASRAPRPRPCPVERISRPTPWARRIAAIGTLTAANPEPPARRPRRSGPRPAARPGAGTAAGR